MAWVKHLKEKWNVNLTHLSTSTLLLTLFKFCKRLNVMAATPCAYESHSSAFSESKSTYLRQMSITEKWSNDVTLSSGIWKFRGKNVTKTKSFARCARPNNQFSPDSDEVSVVCLTNSVKFYSNESSHWAFIEFFEWWRPAQNLWIFGWQRFGQLSNCVSPMVVGHQHWSPLEEINSSNGTLELI